VILLPQPPESLDYRCAPPCLAWCLLIKLSTSVKFKLSPFCGSCLLCPKNSNL
jgi:hypothetical protein